MATLEFILESRLERLRKVCDNSLTKINSSVLLDHGCLSTRVEQGESSTVAMLKNSLHNFRENKRIGEPPPAPRRSTYNVKRRDNRKYYCKNAS